MPDNSRIFISYRREDSDSWVGRLADELREHFPDEDVFEDISSIDPGADFPTVLNEALATAAAMLVVIGPRWLTATDRQGHKRLDDPGDFVRLEVAESLSRPGMRVFPLLVGGTDMPSERDLPDVLKPLARRNAQELTARHWGRDVEQLVKILKRVPGVRDRAQVERDREAAEIKARDKSEREKEARERAERERLAAAASAPPSASHKQEFDQVPGKAVYVCWNNRGAAVAKQIVAILEGLEANVHTEVTEENRNWNRDLDYHPKDEQFARQLRLALKDVCDFNLKPSTGRTIPALWIKLTSSPCRAGRAESPGRISLGKVNV